MVCVSYVTIRDQHDGVEDGMEGINLSADRDIRVNAEAFAVADAEELESEGNQTETIDSHWNETDFQHFDRGLNQNWSEGYRPEGETFLSQVAAEYYAKKHSDNFVEVLKTLKTQKPPSATPENAKGFAQTFLVALTLHALKLHCDGPVHAKGAKAPNFNVFAQGNPGSGKTFIQMTLLNVVRTVCQRMDVAQSIAPTGCAASLLNGTTTNRFCHLPNSNKESQRAPFDRKWYPTNTVTPYQQKMEALLLLLIDETSMLGRCDFAWIGHRLQEGRSNLKDCAERTFGGIPVRMLFQDLMQLPAVAKKSLTDTKAACDHHQACSIGRSEFNDYLRPPSDSGDVPIVLVMDAVFRQADTEFKDVLQRMREGTMNQKSVQFLNNRRWSKLSSKERLEFWRDGIFLMPTWSRTIPIVKQYLKDIGNPLVIVNADISKVQKGKHLKDIKIPLKNPLMAGADTQLLHNFFVEAKLFNGTVGKLVRLVYRPGESPNSTPPAMPAYAEMEVPGLVFPNGEVWDASRPTVVPIPPMDFRCESKCCTVRTLPLRVHKATTIHKAQGMTIGIGCAFKKVICGFGGNSCGSELVAVSRAQEPADFVIWDIDGLEKKLLFKIGQGAGSDTKRQFCETLLDLQATTIPPAMKLITAHDSSIHKSYGGGVSSLLQWYQNRTSISPNILKSMNSLNVENEGTEFLTRCSARVNAMQERIHEDTKLAPKQRSRTKSKQSLNSKRGKSRKSINGSLMRTPLPQPLAKLVSAYTDTTPEAKFNATKERVIAPVLTVKKRNVKVDGVMKRKRNDSSTPTSLSTPNRKIQRQSFTPLSNAQDWREYYSLKTQHYREGYPKHENEGNRTPIKFQRGIEDLLHHLKEVRCFVPYDGFCGYNSLAKLLNITLVEVLDILVLWALGGDPILTDHPLNPCHIVDPFTMMNNDEARTETYKRAKSCLERIHGPGTKDIFPAELYCTAEDIFVVLQSKNIRGLVLSDVSAFSECQEVVDYIYSEDGVRVVDEMEVIMSMKREINYDVVLINEQNHWVYALPTGSEAHPPHTRNLHNLDNDILRDMAFVNAEVICHLQLYNF